MDITILAAWGEFLGGIAVVVSLVYLAGQIRQNSRLLRSSTASVNSEANTRIAVMLAESPDLASIYHDGLANRDSLTEVARQRFDALLTIQLNNLQLHFRLARDRTMSADVWADMEEPTRWAIELPGWQQYWREWSGTYGGDFRDYIDGLVREGEAAG